MMQLHQSVPSQFTLDVNSGKAEHEQDEKSPKLVKFLKLITPESKVAQVEKILSEAVVNLYLDDAVRKFYNSGFYPIVSHRCLNLFR